MSGAADGLRAALVAAAGFDDDRINIALRQIAEDVEFYAIVRPGTTDETGRRVPRKPSETRKHLRNAERALAEFLEAWSSLGSVGCMLIGQELDAPLGRFQVAKLEELLPALRAARKAAERLPAKESNYARSVLACDAARVLRDVLGVRLSVTGPSREVRNGAHYTRVLRESLALVGEHSCSWEKLAADGLRLLGELTFG